MHAPVSGTSVGRITLLICSIDCKSGLSPPCIVKIFSSMIAAMGKQLKQSVNVFHSLMLYRRLPVFVGEHPSTRPRIRAFDRIRAKPTIHPSINRAQPRFVPVDVDETPRRHHGNRSRHPHTTTTKTKEKRRSADEPAKRNAIGRREPHRSLHHRKKTTRRKRDGKGKKKEDHAHSS